MKQRAKNVSYLVKAVINLAEMTELTRDVVALPKGAELISFNVEIAEANDAGVTADFGIGTEKDALVKSLALNTAKNEQSAVAKSINEKSVITLTLSTTATKGQLIVRALYFLPSEIVVEY